jgi:indolepyruvate ferredoxin oxidoreductase beta subunit
VCPFGAIEAFNPYEYPPISDIEADIRAVTSNTIIVDADQIAIEAGNVLAANVVMIGILAGLNAIPLKPETLRATVAKFVPQKALDVNMKAFDAGMEIGINNRKQVDDP